MNGFMTLARQSFLLVCGLSAAIPSVRLVADEPGTQNAVESAAQPATPFERRFSDATVKGAMQHIGSAIIASGIDAKREIARKAFGDLYWSSQGDVELSDDVREAEEIKFEDWFDRLATIVAERKIETVAIVGIDDVASPRCMRWHYLSVDPEGPVLFSMVVYQAHNRARIRELAIETDLATIEAIVDEIELPAGEKTPTVFITPPAAPPAQTASGAASPADSNSR